MSGDLSETGVVEPEWDESRSSSGEKTCGGDFEDGATAGYEWPELYGEAGTLPLLPVLKDCGAGDEDVEAMVAVEGLKEGQKAGEKTVSM